jgi:hypothetical protein
MSGYAVPPPMPAAFVILSVLMLVISCLLFNRYGSWRKNSVYVIVAVLLVGSYVFARCAFLCVLCRVYCILCVARCYVSGLSSGVGCPLAGLVA